MLILQNKKSIIFSASIKYGVRNPYLIEAGNGNDSPQNKRNLNFFFLLKKLKISFNPSNFFKNENALKA